MDEDINKLFEDSAQLENARLSVATPKVQRAITSLPDDFQIRTMSDIRILEELVAVNYTKGIRLYRGHESCDYKIESTIVRHVKANKTNCSIQDILDAEKKAYNLFCSGVFKKEWMQNKSGNSEETLFKMSIGRHLGLPCRLIDVTASLETAIWFAVINPRHYNEDGEIILIILDKEKASGENRSPFNTLSVSYSHEAFLADLLDELPMGEQRRFVQSGHFLWVDDRSLLSEEQVIADYAFCVKRFTIPWQAKLSLAIDLFRGVYSGGAYESDIANIKRSI